MNNLVTNVNGIPGLSLLRSALNDDTAARIHRALSAEQWSRWQHWRPFSRQDFGYQYDLSTRGAMPTTPIPAELAALFPLLRAAGWQGPDPTQVIVTRYPRGGSLGRHIDAPIFGAEIGGISLGAEWPILFSRSGRNNLIPLPVLSTYVMRERARTDWFHQVPPCHDGERISLTFRTMAPAPPPGNGRRRPPSREYTHRRRRPAAPVT